jgi:hypothetical protein
MATLAAPTRKGEQRLLWKIDLLLMPLMIVSLGMQFYDKAALGSSAAFGIMTDLVSSCCRPPTYMPATLYETQRRRLDGAFLNCERHVLLRLHRQRSPHGGRACAP